MRNFRLTSYSKNEKELMNSMPLTGPSTYEEAVTRIEQAECEMDADDGASWEEVLSEAKNIDETDRSLYDIDPSLPEINNDLTPEELERLILEDVHSIYEDSYAV